MRRILTKATAALVMGVIVAVAIGAAPASAANVRYRAAGSCNLDGKEFRADIHTWGKPTRDNPGVFTEVQLWGYKFDARIDAAIVAAVQVRWYDGSWHPTGPMGVVNQPPADGKWHNGPRNTGVQDIGYLNPNSPFAIRITAYTGGLDWDLCSVFLRPVDLVWIG